MRSAEETGAVVRFNAEARTRYLKFAKSAEAKWTGNFRDLSASVTRLATLADGGRIPVNWWKPRSSACTGCGSAARPGNGGGKIRLTPAARRRGRRAGPVRPHAAGSRHRRVPESDSLSEAGRKLYDRSRTQRTVVNDADRLRKYLLKFGLNWESVSGREG